MDAVRFRRSQIIKQNTGSLLLGTAVKFIHTRNGQLVHGKVKKVNRKFILVDTGITVWRVPANMLERV
jgi:ribosomal protein S1